MPLSVPVVGSLGLSPRGAPLPYDMGYSTSHHSHSPIIDPVVMSPGVGLGMGPCLFGGGRVARSRTPSPVRMMPVTPVMSSGLAMPSMPVVQPQQFLVSDLDSIPGRIVRMFPSHLLSLPLLFPLYC
ncbi:hypothetical protein T439DRAFT_86309 [Meredithblackwellia eburnea MCA 4105]